MKRDNGTARLEAAGPAPILPAVFLVFALAAGAAAQWVPPDIEVSTVSTRVYPHIEEDEAQTGTAAEFAALQSKSASVEEIAKIRVIFKGKWYQSADYLAREKAAALGANYLILLQSTGDEDLGAGAVRSYKAMRLLDFQNKPLYIRPAEQPPPAARTAAWPAAQSGVPAQAAQTGVGTAPATAHRHFTWVWREAPYKLSHTAVFDAALAGPEAVADLKSYVRENFKAKQYTRLLRALEKRSKILVDFKKREVR